MAWNVMLGMGEDEGDYLLGEGRCKKCGHFNALHLEDDSYPFELKSICLILGCDCGADVN